MTLSFMLSSYPYRCFNLVTLTGKPHITKSIVFPEMPMMWLYVPTLDAKLNHEAFKFIQYLRTKQDS